MGSLAAKWRALIDEQKKLDAAFLLAGMDTLAALLASLNRVKELDQLATRLMSIR